MIRRSNKNARTMAQRNPNNVLIQRENVEQILRDYGVTEHIRDICLYQTAMVHKSYLKTAQQPGTIKPSDDEDGSLEPMDQSYERLEFIGDTVLGSAIGTYLYARYPDQDEGFMTKLKTKLVRDTTCAELCRILGLQRFIVLSQYLDQVQNSRENEKFQEDVFEAFLGAMYVDFGGLNLGQSGRAIDLCHNFIIRLYETHINFPALIHHDDNFKDQLLRYFQRNFGGQHPKYQIISEHGPTNHRVYEMGVMDIHGNVIGCGRATKKIQAEQMASMKALEHLGAPLNESL